MAPPGISQTKVKKLNNSTPATETTGSPPSAMSTAAVPVSANPVPPGVRTTVVSIRPQA